MEVWRKTRDTKIKCKHKESSDYYNLMFKCQTSVFQQGKSAIAEALDWWRLQCEAAVEHEALGVLQQYLCGQILRWPVRAKNNQPQDDESKYQINQEHKSKNHELPHSRLL